MSKAPVNEVLKSTRFAASLSDDDLPRGFSVYGIRAGISNKPGKKDLALFYSSRPAAAAAVFTTNLVKAAPVILSQKHVRSGSARAVLINSGCANACTGARGAADALASARAVAVQLGVRPKDVLVASTGVIGRYLPRTKLLAGARRLAGLARAGRPASVKDAVAAIMTTDTRPKTARASFRASGRTFTVWGTCKGAGMIHPNMATMLSCALTDAPVAAPELRAALRWAAQRTFNRVTVDGDTSTNDTLFLLANAAGGPATPSALRKPFRAALFQVCLSLSRQIAADGEGATRTAWIFVEGARSERGAARLAATVATSPLVKTALHGADPNWGRVLAALGRAGVPFDPARAEIRFGDVLVYRKGGKAEYSEKALHKILTRDSVTIRVDLRQGRHWSHYVTCDYSKDYISINADYTT